MHNTVVTVCIILGTLVVTSVAYILLWTGIGATGATGTYQMTYANRLLGNVKQDGAVLLAEKAVEKSMADNYDIYCYGINAYRYSDFSLTELEEEDNTLPDIYERDLGVTWTETNP
jgi:hypothetical protein